ncbi:glycine dehydrogenase [Annulohypoxylon truncatum]|uniref:glycine dehydrogenase n=1 Tax=Annulohypoxylon truncatum TaxID=327061 RepID=UPI0020088AB3|nr:glycine dehydrogenase [Annulohypoxylon truncatum]KAI1212744.1 glycine dehydrogenase [Annulohypoxylon truncatum]
MASFARALPRRIGQSAALIRASSSLSSRLRPLAPLACNRCVYKAVTAVTQRRLFSTDEAAEEPKSNDPLDALYPLDTFPRRHIGPDEADTVEMLKALSPPAENLNDFIGQVIPPDIFSQKRIQFPAKAESYLKNLLKGHQNDIVIKKSFIGQGYYGTHTPTVILRNVLENPAWYTSYTPYQPEISQGRLESLLNFQTMVTDLTSLPIANASLLDEGTAAAEAMTLSMNALSTSNAERQRKTFVVSKSLHPQTISVLRGRADGFGIQLLEVDLSTDASRAKLEELGEDLLGVMVQYPDTYGQVDNFEPLADLVHKQGGLLSVATDLLALTMLKPPGEWGADIAFGSAQRFGVPMGYGGPHAAFFAVKEKYKRKMPGRLVGLSKDRLGDKAYRLALQTREQHIRREKATSNVCTSQALLANMSAFYAIYHGPEGLKAIAEQVILGTKIVKAIAEVNGFVVEESRNGILFDTVTIDAGDEKRRETLLGRAYRYGLEFRAIGSQRIGISVDETTGFGDFVNLFQAIQDTSPRYSFNALKEIVKGLLKSHAGSLDIPEAFRRTSSFLTHPVFNTHHSETELLRYIYHLQSKDLSLVHSMIPLGSCTMKLNGTTEMSLITVPKFSQLHPYTAHQFAIGIKTILQSLVFQLRMLTGMDAVSLQPNSGAQGEFAGLRVIREFHKQNGDESKKRDICLIPVSAHGTNPASAAMAGMRVVPIKCDTVTGNLDLEDLEAKCKKHQDELGAIMVTYPSTFGVFEPEIKKVCQIVHDHGGLVYMDGANMNAQIGLCSPGEIGADVCHLNLHKTFCIPHGGGGPGVGPICVKRHLRRFLPGNPISQETKATAATNAVSSAEFGSASISLISWAYNSLMGSEGLIRATKITLLNANYMLSRLKDHYEILYVNEHGRCAHEFILDARPFHKTAGIEAIDIAKRLQDYGFHAPTMSWPVANTLMIEPTESESKEELDRYIDALISIRGEIREIEEGKVPREGNVLKMSPHTMQDLVAGDGDAGGKWERVYSREKAAYPLPWLKEKKFWPTVTRIDDVYGDLNLFCTCPPVEDTTGS